MVQESEICFICSNVLIDHQFLPIDKELETKLSNISDKLLSNIKKSSIICTICFDIVNLVDNFKTQCLQTEERLAPHMLENEEIELKFINENENHEDKVLEVCRLCFCPLDAQSCSPLRDIIQDVNIENIFEEYITNMNFKATKNPMVCEGCQKSILQFTKLLFLMDINGGTIKQEDVDVEIEDDLIKNNPGSDFDTSEEDSDDNFTEEISIEIVPSDMEYLLKNDYSDPDESTGDTDRPIRKRKINRMKRLKQKRKHKNIMKENVKEEPRKSSDESSKRFICDICGRRVRTKKYLLDHKKNHEHLEDCPNRPKEKYALNKCDYCEEHKKIYMCEFCGYRTNFPGNFKVHLRVHHPVENGNKAFKCDLCTFKTGMKTYLVKHKLRMHQDPSQIQWFRCPFCDFKTKDKFFLSRHILVMHEEIDEKDMLHCDKCSFKSKAKDSLKKHMSMRHVDTSAATTYFCELCSYKTIFPIYLNRHVRNKHGDPALKPHACPVCNVSFKYTQTLKNHMWLKHKEMKQVYKCDLCDFKAQLPRYVRKHYIRIHEKPTRKTKSKKAVIHVVTRKRDGVKQETVQ